VSARRPGDPRADALLSRHLATFSGAAVPVPVEAIAEDLLGLRVRVEPSLAASGMLIPSQRRILLNGAETPLRRRFTLAHELGHWTVHCAGPSPTPILCRAVGQRPEPDAREREANVFAADLLMPEREVRAAVADGAGIAALVEAFDVSDEAIAWRLFNLGLVASRPGT
jgi:Zn-dependent peptidase ImmA (M78 family)